ncbi:MAG TPA: hypothetical protein VFW62_07995 [bacterium]|nr:hypothetical protein [bacterium]
MTLRKLGLALLTLPLLTACPAKKEIGKDAAKPQAAAPAASPTPAAKEAPVLKLATPVEATQGFYDAIAGENYAAAWGSLTKKSQEKFVTMVAGDEKMDKAKVQELFDSDSASIRNGFWRSFRNSSKLDIYAPGATYKVVSESGDVAEVEMTSGSFALKSKAFKEDGKWKLGYVETFLPEEGAK